MFFLGVAGLGFSVFMGVWGFRVWCFLGGLGV